MGRRPKNYTQGAATQAAGAPAPVAFVPEHLNRSVAHPTARVLVNELKKQLSGIEPDQDVYIEVRGLSLGEIMRGKEQATAKVQAAVAAIAEAINTGRTGEAVTEWSDLRRMGAQARVYFETAVAGAGLQEDMVAHLAEYYPMVLIRIADKILELSGTGPDAKKKQPDSGETTQTSAQSSA